MNDSKHLPHERVNEVSPISHSLKNSLFDYLSRKEQEIVERLIEKTSSFEAVHIGETDLRIGTLLTFFQRHEEISPPRTGHIGNWDNIVRGRSGAMDFNNVICKTRIGYPLIYSFTQTESSTGNTGDQIYLPGSVISNNSQAFLRLFTWNGSSFQLRPRNVSWFCPFVKTDLDGTLVSLVDFHWHRMNKHSQFQFKSEAKLIDINRERAKIFLSTLFASALKSENSNRTLKRLISHEVRLDGTMQRSNVKTSGTGFLIGDSYTHCESFVKHALFPFSAVANSNEVLGEIESMPENVPLVSHLVTGVMSALFASHSPTWSESQCYPVNIHYHWGARDMAGYPPRRHGYFMSSSSRNTMSYVMNVLRSSDSSIPPLCIVLLPSSIFMLVPSSAFPDDKVLLNILFHKIQNMPTSSRGVVSEIEELTLRWLLENRFRLSSYFLNRFFPGRGIIHPTNLPVCSEPAIPKSFKELSVKEACIVVGCLMDAIPECIH